MSVANKTLLKNQQKPVLRPTAPAPRIVSNPMTRPASLPQAQVRTTTQDIVVKEAMYVDLNKKREPKKLHLTAVTILFVAAVFVFQIGKVMTEKPVEVVRVVEKVVVSQPPPPPVATTVYKNIEPVQMPEVVDIAIPRQNSYERQLVYDDIVKKYNILQHNADQQRNVELAAFRDSNRKFYDNYGYQAIYDKYRSFRTELMAQKDVEMCERVGARCDQAEDYKNYQASRSPASPTQ
jgi:hypothetical protein